MTSKHFQYKEPKTGEDKEREEQYAVVMKNNDGEFVALFHTNALDGKPAVAQLGQPNPGAKIWDETAGANDYIREHKVCYPGAEYAIINRKGEFIG